MKEGEGTQIQVRALMGIGECGNPINRAAAPHMPSPYGEVNWFIPGT